MPVIRDTAKTRAATLGGFVGSMWLVRVLDMIVPGPGSAAGHGIIPRTVAGLEGIPTAPFIHASLEHLAANTIPLIILGSLILFRGVTEFLFVALTTGLIAGVGTWLFGAPATHHIGASGLVFGFFGYLLFRTVFDRRWSSALITIVVAVLYGTAMLSSLVPRESISWTGHFFGFVGGFMAARWRYGRRVIAFCLAFIVCGLSAQAAVWQPSPGHTQMPIWPSAPPNAQKPPGPETATTRLKDHLVAGRPWTYITNVSRPTLTVYSPKGKNTGAAVVVFPGGGYRILAIDLEGTEVCDWLTSQGITCVLLKYRVPNAGPFWNQQCGCNLNTKSSMPLEDAQRTISVVRHRAAEWHIDPHKIGVLGFSAGGHLVAAVSTHFDRRVYRAVDAADRQSCRPDFAVAIYPGHLFDYETREMNPELHVTPNTPPTFLLHAENDNVDPVSHSLVYYEALKNAGVPVEMHLYADGRHAFGLRRTNLPITAWPRLVETWLRTIGMTP